MTADVTTTALEPATREQRRTLVLASAGTLVALVAFTVPLSVPASTAAGLGAGRAGQAWILSSMSVGLAAALLAAGALADDHGRRRVLVWGAALLGVTSLAGALTTSTLPFVLARIAQGAGGGAVIASSLGLIGHAFPAGPRRAGATGIWGAALGGGIALGPLMAAALDPLGWPASYVVLGAAGIVLAVVARLLLTESRAEERRPVDVPGVLLLVAGLVALLAGLVEARGGIARPLPLALLVAGVVLLVAFAVVERRVRAPMLDPALFRSPDFVAVTVAALATGMGVIATMSFVSTLLQRGMAASPLVSGLVLLGWSGTSVLTALAARRLPATFAPNAQMAASLVLIALGQLALLGVTPGTSALRLLPGVVIAGIGSGVLNAALGRQAIASVPPGRGSVGSGANNTARYVGSAVGVTIVAVVATRPSLGTGPAALIDGWDHAVPIATVFTLLGAAVVLACHVRARRTAPAR